MPSLSPECFASGCTSFFPTTASAWAWRAAFCCFWSVPVCSGVLSATDHRTREDLLREETAALAWRLCLCSALLSLPLKELDVEVLGFSFSPGKQVLLCLLFLTSFCISLHSLLCAFCERACPSEKKKKYYFLFLFIPSSSCCSQT